MPPPRSLALITGGASGLGLVAARQLLLQHGWDVLLACRSAERGAAAAARLNAAAAAAAAHAGSSSSTTTTAACPATTAQAALAPAMASAVECDLSSLASVRRCAAEVTRLVERRQQQQQQQQSGALDALVLNAAVITRAPRLTPDDGLDEMWQVNCVAQHLLVRLLLPLLRAPAPAPPLLPPARVVFVSSANHASVGPADAAARNPRFFFDLHGQQQQQQARGLELEQGFAQLPKPPPPTSMALYAATKLWNVWQARQLARELQNGGLGGAADASTDQQQQHQGGGGGGGSVGAAPRRAVVASAVTPGFVPSTGLGRHLSNPIARLAMRALLPLAPFAVSEEVGAGRIVALVVNPEEEGSGRYYARGAAEAPSEAARDDAAAAAAWRVLDQAAGLALR